MSESIPYDTALGPKGIGSAPAGYEPDEEEKKAIELVERCFEKAKSARKPYEDGWLDNYRMFRGKQWKDFRPSYRHSEVLNLIFRAIQSEVPILTDARPKPEFTPQDPSDYEVSLILNDVLDSDWQSANWLHTLTESIYDAHFYGVGFGFMGYDPKALMNKGRVEYKSADPFFFYPDPSARDVNVECNYVVYAEPVAIEKLKRKYPNHAEYIKADLLDLTRREKANFDQEIKYRSNTDSRSIYEGKAYNLENKDDALEVTLYIKDPEYTEEEKREMGQDGIEKSIFIQKLKYPRGRKIVVVNGVLVDDCEIPYEDAKFPFVRLLNYILPREFWGVSEVEQLASPQRIFNKLVSYTLDVLTLMGNPVWVVDSGSGVDTDNLFNRPGLVVEKEPGSEVRREEGVQLQPYVLQLIDRMKGYFDDISGSNDVSRGVKPEGVTAASAIEALQEAAQIRLRQKTRNIDTFMQDWGQMYLSRVFQYYDVPRVFRVTNDQNVQKYFKFHVEQQPEVDPVSGMPTGQTKPVAKVRQYLQGPDGNYSYGEEMAYQISGQFDVRVSGGSGLPFEKQRVESQTYQLFDRGIIDQEEVLKNIKYPNAEAVLQRMAQKAAEAQAMAMPPEGAPPEQAPPPAQM